MLSRINRWLVRLHSRLESEEGQALAEYGLILALIAVVAIAALTAMGVAVTGTLDNITAALP